MRSTTPLTLGILAEELLRKMNDPQRNYFAALETLPAYKPYNADKVMAASTHPLVLIESQMTLFQLKKTLEELTLSQEMVSAEVGMQPLDKVLIKRFTRLSQTGHEAYFYGTTLPFKANDACIELAQSLDHHFWRNQQHAKEMYAQRLIPNLEYIANEDFKFSHHEITFSQDSPPKIALMPRETPAPTVLDQEAGNTLYDILYTNMANIPDLIERLYEYVPQNTWGLYINSYSMSNLLMLAMDKPDKKECEELSETEFAALKTCVQTFLSDTEKHQNDLWLLCDSNHQRATFKQNDERWMKAVYFVLITLSARIRACLTDFLGSGGSWTGYPKEKRLEEANALLQFMTLDLPMKELPSWLQLNHKEAYGRLTAYTYGRYGRFYWEIVQNTGKHLDITDTPTNENAGSSWFSWRKQAH